MDTQIQNSLSCLPLHMALYSQASPGVIEMLSEGYPKAAQVQDKVGHLPLEVAFSKKFPPNILMTLLVACPDVAKVCDDNGYLNIHYACDWAISLELLDILL